MDNTDIIESRRELSQKVIDMVRTKREELGISLALLERLSGIDKGYLSRLERGLRPAFSFGVMAVLFTAMNIDFAEIDKMKKELNL